MSKQQVRTRKKVTAVQQQHYKAVALHGEGLTTAVRALQTGSTGNFNAGAISQPMGGRMSKAAPPQDTQPADKCPEVEIITEVEREKHALAMGDVELCDFITKRLSPARKILRDSIPYLQEARKRFSQPGQRVPVAGKPTWGNWIKRNLGFSDRHVRRLLAGEQNPQKSRSKKSERRAERTSTIAKGDAEALASLWRQALGSLTQMQRRDVLVRFFELIPEEQISDIAAAIEACHERRVAPGSVIDSEETSRRSPQRQDAPADPLSGAQEPGPMSGKVGTPPRKGLPEFRRRKNLAQKKWRESKKRARLAGQAVGPGDRAAASLANLATGDTPHPAAAPAAKQRNVEKDRNSTATPTVKVCLPVLSADEEERIHARSDAASEQPGTRQGDYVYSEAGRWEYEPEVGGEGLRETLNAPRVAVPSGNATRPATQCVA